MKSDSEVFDHYAARAFFAMAWAEQCEETGNGSQLSGREILDLIPRQFDPAAWHAARTLRMDLERENGESVSALWHKCRSLAEYPRGGLDILATFAHYCAMQAMGTGCGLYDFGVNEIRVPYCEFGSHSLGVDYFVGVSHG